MNNDEFHGQGGSYMLNPISGKRTLIERTEEQGPVSQADTVSQTNSLPAASTPVAAKTASNASETQE